MKTALIEFPGHGDGKLFDPEARDAVMEPFIHLRDRFREAGYELMTADEHPVEDAALILLWDFYEDVPSGGLRKAARSLRRRLRNGPPGRQRRAVFAECLQAGITDRTVLFTGEPPVVWPRNWDERVHRLFDVIFTWNDRYVDDEKYHKLHWPVTSRFPTAWGMPFEEKKLLVNVSAHKRSTHPQELYSAREGSIRHFERTQPDGFDLYGFGWDELAEGESPFASYRGTVHHKWDLFPRYRFGLCYENMRDEPGWITEKVFDCMRADCVPIYWGASNVERYIDEDAFIDRRKFSSDEELERYLLSVTPDQYESYRRAISDYLAGERFARFLSTAFADSVLGVLGLSGATASGAGG